MLPIRSITLLTLLFTTSSSMSIDQSEYRSDCCIKTICKEIDMDLADHSAIKCNRREICGEVCKRQPLDVTTKATVYLTRRANYIKQYCLFDQCSTYTFDCVQCPDPKDSDFGIFYVAMDCRKCYY